MTDIRNSPYAAGLQYFSFSKIIKNIHLQKLWICWLDLETLSPSLKSQRMVIEMV